MGPYCIYRIASFVNAKEVFMRAIKLVSRLWLPAMGLVISASAMAAEQAWWQRVDGYASISAAAVKATPDTGGSITAELQRRQYRGRGQIRGRGHGRRTSHYLPTGTLGARFNQTAEFHLGRRSCRAIPSAIVCPPRRWIRPAVHAADRTSRPIRETSLFKMDASDITATAGYSRWNGTVEVVAG